MRHYLVLSFILSSLLGCSYTQASTINPAHPALIPLPQKIQWLDQTIEIKNIIIKQANLSETQKKELSNAVHNLQREVGLNLAHTSQGKPVTLQLEIGQVTSPINNNEAYTLSVKNKAIHIKATTTTGLFYGLQTLRQLITIQKGKPVVATCQITDWPAFKIRGLMHDVGRNYLPIEQLKKQMDILASYKLNVFHFHLTDHPGFRVESKKYPQLNQEKNMRPTRKPGQYYTQKQLKEFLDYCKARHIMVIPEMDMPGHSAYFKQTFGFEMQTPQGAKILKELMAEWVAIFDAPYFHIGADEVRIKMKDFIPQMVAELRQHNKQVITWRPGGRPIDNQIITQLWRARTKTLADVKYIDSRGNYVNHINPLIAPIRAFYQQPCRQPQGDNYALGGILCYWPDVRVDDDQVRMKISPIYPAIVAYSESIWRGVKKDYPEYWAKLPQADTKEFKAFVEFEDRLIQHRDRYFTNLPFCYIKQTNLPWKLIGPFSGPLDQAFGPEKKITDKYTVEGKQYAWHDQLAYGGTIHLRHFFGFPGYIQNAKTGTVYALTYIHSDQDQDAHMLLGFNTPSTSGRRELAPKQGQWNGVPANIWLNDQPIAPPKWTNPNMKGGREVAFDNEIYSNRPPTRVHLKKGWNKLLIKASHGKYNEVKSNKWSFTAIVVSWNGQRATELKNIKYSTNPN